MEVGLHRCLRVHSESSSLGPGDFTLEKQGNQGLQWGKEGPYDSKAFRFFNVQRVGEEVKSEASLGNSAGLVVL